MKTCTKCGKGGIREMEKYCPDCGSREVEVQAVVGTVKAGGGAEGGECVVEAPKGKRVLAFSIDFVGLFILMLLTNFPGFGMIAALIALLYQLMRDYRGASLGKVICQLIVVSSNGNKASVRQCLMRNIIFIAPFFALFIPGLGFLAGGPFVLLLYFVELLLLLTTGRRIGDRMAGTTVIKRS